MKHYNNNKEQIIEVQKQWVQNNRERVNKYQRDKRANLSPEELEIVREKERQQAINWKRNKCTSGIYTITNKVNGKVYVGESYAIENRWHSHRSALNRKGKCNRQLLSDWETYGEQAFEFKIIKELTNSSKMIRLIEEERTITEFENSGIIVYNADDSRNKII